MSDYGSEIEWTEELETQCQLLESRASKDRGRSSSLRADAPSSSTTRVPAPHVEIVLEESAAQAQDAPMPPRMSLLSRFRRNGRVSVSDLVGPLWCEVQHSYRLGSKAHLPPALRPKSILTASGSVIQVDDKKTVAREVILDKGKAVHKTLETEVMGDAEPVKVDVTSKEESWMLRLLNIIVCLETLLATGRAREVPVFGFVDQLIVFGVIDEVEKREFIVEPPAPPRGKKTTSPAKKVSTPPDQSKLDQYFSQAPSPSKKGRESGKAGSPPSSPSRPPEPTKRSGFLLSDTKTRYNDSMPRKADSRSARLQLMLYHRLLSTLLELPAPQRPHDTSPPKPTLFDWDRLFTKYELDANQPMSESFRETVQPILLGLSLSQGLRDAWTLRQYVDALRQLGRSLVMLEDFMEISYRLRNATVHRRLPKKRKREVAPTPVPEPEVTVMDVDEDVELQRAIELSLLGQTNSLGSEVLESQTAVDLESPSDLEDMLAELPSMVDPLTLEGKDLAPPAEPDLPPNSQQADDAPFPACDFRSRLRPRPDRSRVKRARTPSPIPVPSSTAVAVPIAIPPAPPSPPAESMLAEGTLIGCEQFYMSARELDRFLESSIRLWKGEREPIGVSVENVKRCRTCEFESGCEWLTTKAREAAERNKTRTSRNK